MPLLVLVAEVTTIALMGLFVLMLASDGLRGPVFTIASRDPIGRFFIRNIQIAFVLGYGGFFAFQAYRALAL